MAVLGVSKRRRRQGKERAPAPSAQPEDGSAGICLHGRPVPEPGALTDFAFVSPMDHVPWRAAGQGAQGALWEEPG